MSQDDIDNRFNYHPPVLEGKAEAHSLVRSNCKELAEALAWLLPSGREKSLAITKLEEVMFWANAAIARN